MFRIYKWRKILQLNSQIRLKKEFQGRYCLFCSDLVFVRNIHRHKFEHMPHVLREESVKSVFSFQINQLTIDQNDYQSNPEQQSIKHAHSFLLVIDSKKNINSLTFNICLLKVFYSFQIIFALERKKSIEIYL